MSNINDIAALAGTGIAVFAATQSFPVQIESVEGRTVHATIPELGWREVVLTPEDIFLHEDDLPEIEDELEPDNIDHVDFLRDLIDDPSRRDYGLTA